MVAPKQRTVHEMILEEGLYNGLNKPGLPETEADVTVFSIPFDEGVSARSGAKHAPASIREL